MQNSLTGTWILAGFRIESDEGQTSEWGSNAHGLLIYAPTGHMSVSINADIENNPKQTETENIFESILFYSGTYRVDGNTIRHVVTEASNPSRIGKEMIRYAEFKDNTVVLTTPKESFGRAILTWKKV